MVNSRAKRGTGFRGVLDYLCDHDDGHHIGGNMSGHTPRTLAHEFGIGRQARPDVGKPVWHMSLRLPVGEKLTEDRWVEVADAFVSEMGFSDKNQRAYFIHNCEAGQHIHIVCNRAGLDGSLWYGVDENLKATKICQSLENRFGLGLTQKPELDKKTNLPSARSTKKRKAPKKPETEKSLRTLVKPPRIEIADLVDKCLSTDKPKTPESLKSALESRGVEVEFFSENGEIKGITFFRNGLRFAGSSLGSDYKFPSILKRMKENHHDSTKFTDHVPDSGDGIPPPQYRLCVLSERRLAKTCRRQHPGLLQVVVRGAGPRLPDVRRTEVNDRAIKTSNRPEPSDRIGNDPDRSNAARTQPPNSGFNKKGLVARGGRKATEAENRAFQLLQIQMKGKNMENEKQLMVGALSHARTEQAQDAMNMEHGWNEFTDRNGRVWFYDIGQPPAVGNRAGYSWDQEGGKDGPPAIRVWDCAVERHGVEQAAIDAVRICVFKSLPEPLRLHGTPEFQRFAAREMHRLGLTLKNEDGPGRTEYDRLEREKEKAGQDQINAISATFANIDAQAAATRRAALARAAEMEDTPSKKDGDRMRMGPRQ